MKDFTAGDRVYVVTGKRRHRHRLQAFVERTTKTQIIVNGTRYRRKETTARAHDGWRTYRRTVHNPLTEIGGDSWLECADRRDRAVVLNEFNTLSRQLQERSNAIYLGELQDVVKTLRDLDARIDAREET